MGATASVASLPSFSKEDIATYLSNRAVGLDAASRLLREKTTINGERVATALQMTEQQSAEENLLMECGFESKSEAGAQLLLSIIHDIRNSRCLHPYLERWGSEYHCVDCMEIIDDNERLQVEDLKMRGIALDNLESDYGKQSALRGVTIEWLIAFTEANQCWEMKTWEVRRKFILPATSSSRCRYVELPHMLDAVLNCDAEENLPTVGSSKVKVVGQAATFVSHCWGARWGDLVSAITDGCSDRNRRVWIDIFAVRQWPSTHPDLDFASTIRNCSSFMLVCSSLADLHELSHEDILSRNTSSVSAQLRKRIAFLRVWCLVEICAAVRQPEMTIVMKCGSMSDDTAITGQREFKVDTSILQILYFLIDIKSAEATVASDKVMILAQVEKDIGTDTLNRRVRSAIIGSAICAKHPMVQCAACGDGHAIISLEDDIQSSFVSAAGGGYLTLMLNFLERGADLNCTSDADGMTALLAASFGGHVDAIKILLERGADIQSCLVNGMTALLLAAGGGHTDAVRLLLSNGADAHIADCDGGTPLMYSSLGGHIDVVKLLLHYDVDVSATALDGMSAVTAASAGGHFDIVKLLQEHGCEDINTSSRFSTESDGKTPLMWVNCSRIFQ